MVSIELSCDSYTLSNSWCQVKPGDFVIVVYLYLVSEMEFEELLGLKWIAGRS